MITILDFILIMVCAVSIAATLIFAAKWQDAKQKIWDERSVWLSEVKALEHDKEILLEGSRHDADAILWYADELSKSRREITEKQDKLSAILCPTENHVWVCGVCKKCGRMQDD